MREGLDSAIVATIGITLATALLPLAGSLGCSYDWEIGAPNGGAGGQGSGGAGASGSGGSGAGGAGGGGGADCGALAAQLDAARKAAKACTIGAPGQCSGFIEDECGCDSYVTQSSSAATDEFVAAVGALQSAGCPPDCSTCLLGSGTCLFDNGMGPYCQP